MSKRLGLAIERVGVRAVSAVVVASALALTACGSDDAGGDGDAAEIEIDERPAAFTVDGSVATMSGLIGPSTPDGVRSLLDEHPDVDTIVMRNVPGSDDDAANLEASRLLFEAGLATHVPADGLIASGGVDFYLAGAERTYESGAQLGVHSWAAGDDLTGADLPRDDPEHELYLDYYDEIEIDADFYWFTLEAAPAEGMHYMSDDEIDRYDVGELVDGVD